MKNPRYEKHPTTGKFWCNHSWQLQQGVGTYWWVFPGVKALCECSKCGKRKYVCIAYFEEIPDEMINDGIVYSL